MAVRHPPPGRPRGRPLDVVPDRIARTAVTPLPVHHGHALHVAGLPPHHGDPFDRLLVAQAQLEDVPVLTADSALGDYDVEIVFRSVALGLRPAPTTLTAPRRRARS